MISWARRWLPLWVLWVLVTGATDTVALLTGGLAAAAAASLAAWSARTFAPAGMRAGWLRHLPGVAAQALRDCVLLATVVARRLRGRPVGGRFVEVPFEHGDDAADAARRAFVTMTTSAMPNSYVVGFDRHRGTAVVHELDPQSSSPIATALTRSR